MRIGHHMMGRRLGLLAVVVSGLALAAGTGGARDDDRDGGGSWGAVFTLTNNPAGNELAVFGRDGQGRLAAPVFYPTGGAGTGTGLGNQGALALGDDAQYLYAVNTGSDTISVFRLGSRGPRAVQVIASGGARPISLTVADDLLYVLNAGGGAAGGVDSIAGFEIGDNGLLHPLSHSVTFLSAGNTGPAQIGFSAGGDVLTVTEKATNTISQFVVNRNGRPGARRSVASNGQTPFGFAYTGDDLLIVSEAFGGAANASAVSSYGLDRHTGTLSVVSPSVPTTETAACWIALTDNDAYAYASNTASRTLTGYHVGGNGRLTILNENGVTATTGSTPTDLTVLGSRVVYALNSGDGSVGSYSVGQGGTLTARPAVGGLPPTHPTGLVVR